MVAGHVSKSSSSAYPKNVRGKRGSRAPTNWRRDPKPHALPVHPWSEQHGPLRGRLGSAQIFSGRLAGSAHLWWCTGELAHEVSRPLSRFVDFGEVSETCAPVSNEAKRPSRSAQYRLTLYGGEVGYFKVWLARAAKPRSNDPIGHPAKCWLDHLVGETVEV